MLKTLNTFVLAKKLVKMAPLIYKGTYASSIGSELQALKKHLALKGYILSHQGVHQNKQPLTVRKMASSMKKVIYRLNKAQMGELPPKLNGRALLMRPDGGISHTSKRNILTHSWCIRNNLMRWPNVMGRLETIAVESGFLARVDAVKRERSMRCVTHTISNHPGRSGGMAIQMNG